MSAISIDNSNSTISIKDLVALLNQHEEIIITDKTKPIVKLTSLNQEASQAAAVSKHRQGGLSEGVAWISPDFNEPLEDFAEYMP